MDNNILDENNSKVAQIDPVICLSINLQNALNHFRLLKDSKFPDTIISKMSDDFYKFYKKHILKCNYFISSNNLLNGRVIIKQDQNEPTPDLFKQSLMKTFYSQNRWLIDLVKDWPFFTHLTDVDFAAIIHKGQLITFAFKISEFKINGECYSVFEDNIWHSRKLMLKYFGIKTTNESFVIHDKLNRLNLTERERAILYPFILTQCNEKNIQDKRLFYYLKLFYSQILFSEFLANKRDLKFMEELNQAFEILSNTVNSFSTSL